MEISSLYYYLTTDSIMLSSPNHPEPKFMSILTKGNSNIRTILLTKPKYCKNISISSRFSFNWLNKPEPLLFNCIYLTLSDLFLTSFAFIQLEVWNFHRQYHMCNYLGRNNESKSKDLTYSSIWYKFSCRFSLKFA